MNSHRSGERDATLFTKEKSENESMDNFAAIDFETANNERTSVCSVGVGVAISKGMYSSVFASLEASLDAPAVIVIYTDVGLFELT